MEIEVYKLFWGYLEHLMVKAILTWDVYYWAFNAAIGQTNRLLEDFKDFTWLTHKFEALGLIKMCLYWKFFGWKHL